MKHCFLLNILCLLALACASASAQARMVRIGNQYIEVPDINLMEAKAIVSNQGPPSTPIRVPPVISSQRPKLPELDAEAKKNLLDLREANKAAGAAESTATQSIDSSSVGDSEVEFELAPYKSFGGTAIWDILADDLFGPESQNLSEKIQMKRMLFAGYLDYLNAVGLELALYENNLKALNDKQKTGKCSKSTQEEYDKILTDSIQSDPAIFVSAYCNSVCNDNSYFMERARFSAPEGALETCEDKARLKVDEFNCEGLGKKPDLETQPSPNIPVGSPSIVMRETTIVAEGKALPLADDFKYAVDRSLDTGTGLDLDAKNLTSRISFEMFLKQRNKECKKADYVRNRTIWQDSDGADKTLMNSVVKKGGLDPRWTTLLENTVPEEELLESTLPVNDVCKTSGFGADHYIKLKNGYRAIALAKIYESLGDWPMFSESGVVDSKYRRAILETSDKLFLALISDLEQKYNAMCSRSDSLQTEEGYNTNINGKNYRATFIDGDEGKAVFVDEEPKQQKPEKVSTYFGPSKETAERFMDGLTQAERTGGATHTENRAGEIADGVKDGSIDPDNISAEARQGPLGLNAKEIEELTRRYLEEGKVHNLQMLAAEMAGSFLSGGIASRGVKAAGSVVKSTANFVGGGRLSTLLVVTKRLIMVPFGMGSQSGSFNAGVKVLQTGGKIFEERTAKELNKAFGKNLTKREWGKALENLKRHAILSADHHGKILSNGDYLGYTEKLVGNINDFIY